ncbi:Cystinosin -like protein [Halotydeus destructor]|nr:Cystinosin -like protein [Halotydeus destructor]
MMFEEFQNGSFVITEHGPKSDLIDTVALIAGWISFASWSACLMPQIYSNHRRKSASGLSFDFLGLNVTGFSFYLTFTSCLYFVKSFQDAYREVSGPEAELPVRLSDVALGTLCLSTDFGSGIPKFHLSQ